MNIDNFSVNIDDFINVLSNLSNQEVIVWNNTAHVMIINKMSNNLYELQYELQYSNKPIKYQFDTQQLKKFL